MKVRRRDPATRKPVGNSETGEFETLELSVTGAARYMLFNGIPLDHVRSAMKIGWRLLVGAVSLVVIGNAMGSDTIPQFFARETDVKSALAQVVAKVDQLTKEQRAERLEALDTEIFKLRRDYCRETNAAVKSQYAERVNELKNKYFAATGQLPRIAPCDET